MTTSGLNTTHSFGQPTTDAAMAWWNAWLMDADRLHTDLANFATMRMGKDMELLFSLTACASPSALVDLQANAWADMVTDYADAYQKTLLRLRDTAQRQWDEWEKQAHDGA